jgi:hypothetical protein
VDEEPRVMSRTEWFKFLKLAFEELACEYPALLSESGVVFQEIGSNTGVDCVDKDLLA